MSIKIRIWKDELQVLTLSRDLKEAAISFAPDMNSVFKISRQYWDMAYIKLENASGLCGEHTAGLGSSLEIFAEFIFIPRINTCNILIKSAV